MTFAEQLNEYLKTLKCTTQDIAKKSGIPASVIGRFRNGKAVPQPDKEPLRALAVSLVELASERDLSFPSLEEVTASFQELITIMTPECKLLSHRANILLKETHVSLKKLAKETNYDPAFLQAICNGVRCPQEPAFFAERIARYFTVNFSSSEDKNRIADLISCPPDVLEDNAVYFSTLCHWLFDDGKGLTDRSLVWLKEIDAFNCTSYLNELQYIEPKFGSGLNLRRAYTKSYLGYHHLLRAEQDFLKMVLPVKSEKTIFLYDDTPSSGLDFHDFQKHWLCILALAFRKDMHIDLLLNGDLPFSSLIPSLRHWLPLLLYSNVQIYSASEANTSIFRHCFMISEKVSLSSESLSDNATSGRSYLTNAKDDVTYYRGMANSLLSQAKQMITVYKKVDIGAYQTFMQTDSTEEGVRYEWNAALPLYTMGNEMLFNLLERHHLPAASKNRILDCARAERKRVLTVLAHSPMEVIIPDLSEEEFAETPLYLPLGTAFSGRKLTLTYADYLAHLKLTREFAQQHENFHLHVKRGRSFQQLHIMVRTGKWALLSVTDSTAAQLLLHHPETIADLERLIRSSF